MALVALFSNAVRDPSDDTTRIEAKLSGGKVRQVTGTVQVVTANNAESTYAMAKIPTDAVIDPDSKLYFDAFGAGKTVDIEAVISGTVQTQLLTDGLDVENAGSASVLDSNIAIQNYAKPLWSLMGMTSDPGGLATIRCRIKAVAGADSDLTMVLKYASNN